MPFDISHNVEIRRDQDGRVRQIRHLQHPYSAHDTDLAAPTARSLASAYLHDVAQIYEFSKDLLEDLEAPVGDQLGEAGTRLQFDVLKSTLNSSVVSYQQTHYGLPIWRAGVRVQLHEAPLRVTSSQSTIHYDVKVSLPKKGGESDFMSEDFTRSSLRSPLGLSTRAKLPDINRTRLLIYRYDPDRRLDPESGTEDQPLHAGPPTLPLPAVPDNIEPGMHYLVREILFTAPAEGIGQMHWRAFIEVGTSAVLYLRAFVSHAFGNIFESDPLSLTGNVGITPASSGTTLDPITTVKTLLGLTPPANPGDPQALTGEYVDIQDYNSPDVDPPTAPLPTGNFSFSAVEDDFSAVSAYFHSDDIFRMIQGMGFNLNSYFDGTTFPVPVDHRGKGGAVNAHCAGNVTGDGIGEFSYGLAEAGEPVGIAATVRVILHEFGHALLWDHVDSPNFGFAHSAGDGLAAILKDPGSNAPDRFMTFPWVTTANPGIDRRHDRAVGAGWAWGGANDVGGYSSEQILATTHFRAYRSTGGDDGNIDVKRFAARYMVYLILYATSTLTPMTNPSDPDDWATALMEADTDTLNFEGHPGGAFHKVIRWSFEKQGLYQNPPVGPGDPPVTTEGAPPAVDVYIDDGRNGEYTYQSNFWNTTDLWVRNNPDGGLTHQTPIVGVPNYMYVRVKNRGSETANNVVVSAYNCIPAAGLVWPDDWQPMTTAQLPASGPIPSGGDTVVGPFEWTPQVIGHECVLASVSADDDLSNADPASMRPCATGPIPHWRLVPFDNNIAQRNLAPVAGGGGLRNLVLSFENRTFLLRNPFERTVRVRVEPRLPAFLREKGWGVNLVNPGGGRFTLGPRASRQIDVRLKPGQDFSPEDVIKAGADAMIDLEAYVDNMPVGGMSYHIDPGLKIPPRELPEVADRPDCQDVAEDLLECLNIPAKDVKSVKIKRITVDIDLQDDC